MYIRIFNSQKYMISSYLCWFRALYVDAVGAETCAGISVNIRHKKTAFPLYESWYAISMSANVETLKRLKR